MYVQICILYLYVLCEYMNEAYLYHLYIYISIVYKWILSSKDFFILFKYDTSRSLYVGRWSVFICFSSRRYSHLYLAEAVNPPPLGPGSREYS